MQPKSVKVLLRSLVLCSTSIVFAACANKNCRTLKQEEIDKNPALAAKTPEASMANKSELLDLVMVFKPDGSKQCGQGKKIPLEQMETELKGIKVYARINKNDGMMRTQVCGSNTGDSNVYQIEKKDLPQALKFGFKQWTQD